MSHVDAWAQVLDFDDWTPERSEVIRQAVLAESRDAFTPGPAR